MVRNLIFYLVKLLISNVLSKYVDGFKQRPFEAKVFNGCSVLPLNTSVLLNFQNEVVKLGKRTSLGFHPIVLNC